jgi:hypothetical protein
MRCIEIENYLGIGPNDYNQANPSPQDDNYNCIAFALGVTSKPWWPSKRWPQDFDWPAHLPREEQFQETLDNFIRAFATKGYSVCRSGRFRRGVEKVAIYSTRTGVPRHAARQLEEGVWKSKCGGYEDIEHKDVFAVARPAYGTVVTFMHRRRDGKPFLKDRILKWFGYK